MRGWLFAAWVLWTSPAWATVYYETSFENVSLNHEINDENVDGGLWDTGQNAGAGASFPFPVVRNTVTTPAGTKYVEILTKCPGGHDVNGRCAATNNEANVSMSAFVDITEPSPTHNIVDGRVYYLGAFMRYDRVSSRDHWQDTGTPNNWDKTLEYRGSNFRWGVGVGWPQGNYTATNGKYTFDLWCADTAFTGCQVGGNADHKVQNDSGYSASTPFLADYGKWYAVVMKVTASTTTSGVAELYINGTRIINKTSQVTYTSGGTISDIELWGTLSQADYDRPISLIMMDHILMTDSLTDIQNAGLMSDPEAGGGGGSSTGGSMDVKQQTEPNLIFTQR